MQPPDLLLHIRKHVRAFPYITQLIRTTLIVIHAVYCIPALSHAFYIRYLCSLQPSDKVGNIISIPRVEETKIEES